MSIHPGIGRRGPRSVFLMAVLVAALITSLVLAFEAVSAARMHSRIAERTLRDYSAFALWQLSGTVNRQAEDLLSEAVLRGIFRSFDAGDGARVPPPPVLLDRLALGIREALAGRDLASLPEAIFILDVVRDSLYEIGRVRPDVERWLRTEQAARARFVADSLVRIPGNVQTDGRRSRVFRPVNSVSIRSRTTDGGTSAVAYTLHFREAERYLMGFSFEPAVLAEPVVASVLETQPLLPPALMGRWRNADLLSLRLKRSASGETLAAWGQDVAGGERLALTGALEGLSASVAIPHAVANDLLIGGLPGSRLPLLILLLLLTVTLLATALVQYRRDTELVRLRGDFVSSVSHELRTPLAQIRLFADLLDSGRLDASATQRSVGVIGKEARRLSFLVENILAFSANERRALTVSVRPVEIAPAVREVVESFGPLADARRVTLDVDVEPGLVGELDPDGFRRIVLNLLDNAVKYGPEGQTVRLEASLVGTALRMRIDDQGAGVRPDLREKVWGAYYRTPESIDSEACGSGLGLFLVQTLVHQHGGTAELLEAPAGGTRVEIIIPGARSAAPRPVAVEMP